VIIRYLDPIGVAVVPDEADPPLIIDPDTVLTFAIAFQRFKTVSGRDA
jgi:hypothetical protein